MSERTSKAEQILDAAEKMARIGGYNGFSFREIAKDVGIKAASVHYHFPGKQDLGAAIAKRYTERFLENLGAPDDPGAAPTELLQRYIAAYRHSLVEDKLMCLCGMFGAEITRLPDKVARETQIFFERNRDWLVTVITRAGKKKKADAEKAAFSILATLEGAMILARTLDDPAVFDAAAQMLALE